MKNIVYIIIAILFIGCGGGGGGSTNSTSTTTSSSYTGYFIDAPVSGLEYVGSLGNSGITGSSGEFIYNDGENITFKVGNIILGSKNLSKDEHIITPVKIVENGDINNTKVVQILRFLQTIDDTQNDSTINISKINREKFKEKQKIDLSQNDIDDDTLAYLCDTNTTSSTHTTNDTNTTSNTNDTNTTSNTNDTNTTSDTNSTKSNIKIVEVEKAKEHYEETIKKIDEKDYPKDKYYKSDEKPSTIVTASNSGSYTLIAWNDLGMHCMDDNYSVFSILPPYNTLKAQLINKSTTQLVSKDVNITFEATKNLNSSINTTSVTKTDFWTYAKDLFNTILNNDEGLKGYKTSNTIPQSLKYNTSYGYWEAEGIPITPYNDDKTKSHYQLIKVVAKSNSGVLASTTVVLPVSDEMDCKSCHSSQSISNDAKPNSGWVNNSDLSKDYKLNILRLHDEKHDISPYLSELSAKGYNYSSTLYDTAQTKPVLCAVCHQSNALGTQSVSNISSLSKALHSHHANVKDINGTQKLNDVTNRDSCYSCHPGKETKCLRGAMGKAKTSSGNNAIECQSCHGTMDNMANSQREPWLDEPDCQTCHQNGQRYTSVFTDNFKTLRTVTDTTFATQDNSLANKNLYRFSKGHGNLQCEACHGSTHAIYPSSQAEDNIQSMDIQGYVGTISDCKACHQNVPLSVDGGPHKLHAISQDWVSKHGDYVEEDDTIKNSCKNCHGSDYKGSVLSKTFTARTFKIEKKTKTYKAGEMVTCYDCHNGAKGD